MKSINNLPLAVFSVPRVLALCSIIFAQRLLPIEISAPFIALLGVSIMIFGKISRSYLRLVWPLLGVLIIGFVNISDHESRHILRDIAYALMPISLIFMGGWVADRRTIWPLTLKVMVVCGLILAVMHLTSFVFNPALLSADSTEVRKTIGGSGDLVVLVFLLGLFQRRFGINDLFPKLLPRFIAMPILLASFVLSYSRTGLAVAIILFVSMLGWVSGVNRRLILAIAVIMVGYMTLAAVTPEDETGTFRSKLVRSVTEVAVSNHQDMSDINSNWRGFESYKAVETFSHGNAQQRIFGQGFGALVDLGFYMPLGGGGEVEFRYVPITHNGYVYVLIKTGLFGLICYALFYIYIIRYSVRYSRSMISEQRLLARLLLGCVLSLIFVMFVVGGMAEAHNSELVLLLGYLMRRIGYVQTDRNHKGLPR